MAMNKIFFLDRNALSNIKRKLEGSNVPIDQLKKLRDIDKPGHTISLMLAFREGQNKKIENSDEIKESIEKDARHVNRFYKKANTDANYFLENIELTSDTLSDLKGKEHNWENYIEFLKYAQSILYQPISQKHRYETAEKICKKAHDLTISRGHPTVICAVSALYGNRDSQRVLKAKPSLIDKEADDHAYNVLSDLIIISRLCDLQTHTGQKTILKLVTFDKPLEKLFKLIKVEKIKRIDSIEKTSIETTVTYNHKLFIEAKKEEKDRIIKLLQSAL